MWAWFRSVVCRRSWFENTALHFLFPFRTFINRKLHYFALSLSARGLIIHCVNYFTCTSFPLWGITARRDSIEKSNIINEAQGLFSASLLSPSLCWLSVVSYTVIHFNGLHAWKCKTSRNGKSGGPREEKWREEPQGLLILLSLPFFLLFLNSPSFFQCFFLILSASFPSLSLSFCAVNNLPLPPNTVPVQ